MTDFPRSSADPAADAHLDQTISAISGLDVGEHPFSALADEIRSDDSYAWGWQCNLAMAILDSLRNSGVTHADANVAASRIMSSFFEADVTKFPEYVSLMKKLSEISAPDPATWTVKIGEIPRDLLPPGSDNPMRRAVQEAYLSLTGRNPDFIFSGWGARLTPAEREAQDNMLRNEAMIPPPAEHDDSTVGRHPLTRDSYRAE